MTDVRLPQLGMTMTEAEIVSWLVSPSDHVEEGDELCEIETSKAQVAVPAPCSGTVAEILVPAGTTVEVGTVLARIEQGA